MREVSSPGRSIVTATLRGSDRSDWDLAVFDADGRPAAASTASGSDESAAAPAAPGESLTVQACRLDGKEGSAALEITVDPLLPAPDANERVSLESVAIGGPADIERLTQLGIDLTHDISDDAATVVLYSTAQRALLDRAGYEATPVIADLAAADAAARTAEQRAGAGSRSALPSGRDTYRQYADFTTELRALADANPSLVREVTIGTSLEGRPIQGVEIAQDVLRSDDGRPVYLNFGAHHAREWPSAEMPMEFARDLVARFNGGENRIEDLLADVRVVIVPVVNVDGFIASRSFGFNPLTDDNPNATLTQALAGSGAYRRKNCRPANAADALVPCTQRTSGVDLNRNYGYYWGGSGSSSDPTSQGFRGPSPFSEPEADAVHDYSASVHPTVFITNHTFTDDGKWLRQPGFDDVIAVTEDETAMKSLGDSMAMATGWTSELGYDTLGDITGATEDWNYFAQGTYGYTPEARGPNFHGTYANMVVAEYLGTGAGGVREAFVRAGEVAASEADHGVIQGPAPAGATLRLSKEFTYPTSSPAGGPATVDDELDTTLRVGASGTYSWHVNPSSRPAVDQGPPRDPPAETWAMTCVRPGDPTVHGPVQISIVRGQVVNRDWLAANACGADPTPVNLPPVAGFSISPSAPITGQQVNFISSSTDPDGAVATTQWDLDDDGAFDDATGLAASRSFASPGTYTVSVRVVDDGGEADTDEQMVTVSLPPPSAPLTPPGAGPGSGNGQGTGTCAGLPADIVGTQDRDVIRGGPGRDVIKAGGGADLVKGRGGDDVICGGGGGDRLAGGAGDDALRGGRGRDALAGGGGTDTCRGGPGRDTVRACP